MYADNLRLQLRTLELYKFSLDPDIAAICIQRHVLEMWTQQ